MRIKITSWPRLSLFVVLLAAVTFALLAGGSRIYQNQSSSLENVDFSATQPQSPKAELSMLLMQKNQHSGIGYLFMCQTGHCQRQSPPPAVPDEAVTDGTYWYHYTDDKDEQGAESIHTLQRTRNGQQQSDVIVDTTPLVSPRDHIISPDNNKVAYWLDNIDKPDKELTELWTYNTEAGSTRLLAEKLVRPSILTPVRWNSASNQLWFVGNVAADDEPERLELLVVSSQPPQITARFGSLDWRKLQEIVANGTMDIDSTGRSLAYATAEANGRSQLVITDEGHKPITTSVHGSIPYIQWLEDGSLLYVVQDTRGFTFWRHHGANNQYLARQADTLLSIQPDSSGQHIAFAAQSSQQGIRLFALNITDGTITFQGKLPSIGTDIRLVRVDRQGQESGQVAGSTNQRDFDDAELASFIERNLADIIRQPLVQHQRLLITDEPNTIYADYRNAAGEQERILLTIHNILNAEWSIQGRYQESSGEWIKTQGGGLPDPEPVRIYEWEVGLNQWILKENY